MDTPKPRAAERSRSILGGRIRLPNRASTFDCLVRNVSATGARLELDSTHLLPLEFELEIPKQRLIYSCELKWRSEKAVGVRFKERD